MIGTDLDIHRLNEFQGDNCFLTWEDITNIDLVKITISCILHKCRLLSCGYRIIVKLLGLLKLFNLSFNLLTINLNSHFSYGGICFLGKLEGDFDWILFIMITFNWIKISLFHMDDSKTVIDIH